MTDILKPFALSPQRLVKATEMISRVLKTVSSVITVEILRRASVNTVKKN